MKKLAVVFGLICVVILAWQKIGSLKKITEPEAGVRAQFEFEQICKIPYLTTPEKIYCKTNDFMMPNLTIGKSNPNDLEYSYIWRHKSINLLIHVVVHESGDLTGGIGPIDETKLFAAPI